MVLFGWYLLVLLCWYCCVGIGGVVLLLSTICAPSVNNYIQALGILYNN